MTLLRGKKNGLEIVLSGQPLDEALDELRARLGERPDFYRDTPAVANFGTNVPAPRHLIQLQSVLGSSGIVLRAVAGIPEVRAATADLGVPFEAAEAQEAPRDLRARRTLRARPGVQLSDAARSLVADFAGARADIAQRRKRGEASVPRVTPPPAEPARDEKPPAALRIVEAAPGTLYHTGTLRGGQALHHVGNIVVVGDVNPGAELVATGDVLVFGRLAGVAHAGAQGDAAARVYALELVPTQLRIATFIAADDAAASGGKPEAAFVRDGRIAVVPFDQLGTLPLRGVSA